MTTLSKIMGTLQDPLKKNRDRKKKQRERVQQLNELFLRLFAPECDLGMASAHSVATSSKFLKTEKLPADFRTYCQWDSTWDRRLGKWRFHAPFHVFRAANKFHYLIASIVGRFGLPVDLKDGGGEIFYDPIKHSFSVHELDELHCFESIEEVLRYVHDKIELERKREWAAIRIQKEWRMSRISYSDTSDSDSDDDSDDDGLFGHF